MFRPFRKELMFLSTAKNETPFKIEKLEVGKALTLVLKKEGYLDFTKTINVDSEKPIVVHEKLEKYIAPGYLSVIVQPDGADLSINGQSRGRASGKFEVPAERPLKIVVSKSGSKAFVQTLSVKSGETKTVSVVLEAQVLQFGTLNVQTDPAGASVSVGGESKGASGGPFQVEAGKTIKVSASKEGYRSASQSVSLKPNETKTVFLKLSSTSGGGSGGGGVGNLAVNSNPPGVEVFVGGERKGVTPTTLQVAAGSVEVVVKCKTGAQTKTVMVTAGQTHALQTIDCGTGGEFGSLHIDSDPAGAAFFLDGAATGKKTPVNIRGIRRGSEHTVRLELNGREWSKTFTMDEENKSFFANLKEK